MGETQQVQPTALEGVHAWLDRADEHLSELRTTFQSWLYAERELAMKTARQGDDRESDDSPVLASMNTAPNTVIPPRINVLVGEVAQALRRALDYLVYELALRDSGRIQDGTQFPFERSEAGFAELSRPESERPLLRGVSKGHAAALSRHQPFSGAEWGVQLQAISNPDKHRHLTVTTHRQEVRVRFTERTVQDGVRATAEGYLVSTPFADETSVELLISFRLTIDNDLSVFDVLTDIRVRVRDALETFEPCFRGSCTHGVPIPDAP